jgi:hypothetical protein
MGWKHSEAIAVYAQITGVASDAEFKDYLPAAGDFRAVAPM